MPKRPPLNDKTFLAHVYSPKKNPAPSGIRKTTLKSLAGGRSKARLNAFNKMSPVNQELLKRSGMRDAYLKGQASIADAKRTLRDKAVDLKIVKPLRSRKTATKGRVLTSLDKMIATHLKTTLRAEGKNVNDRTVEAEIVYLGDNADTQILKWDYGRIKHAGRRGSEYEVEVDGATHNPFWYH
jgi:hypothetical protein